MWQDMLAMDTLSEIQYEHLERSFIHVQYFYYKYGVKSAKDMRTAYEKLIALHEKHGIIAAVT
jgi:hypothetical protein